MTTRSALVKRRNMSILTGEDRRTVERLVRKNHAG
jgi:hypothetical protein